MNKFTIYTPVFNSARQVNRVYHSLINQTFTDFEWLIINDGSKDNSSEVIKGLLKTCPFKINFIDLKENIGFNRSMNLAVNESDGELFLICHADDEFSNDALQIFSTVWDNLDSTSKSRIQGIKCNCKDQHGNLLGDLFPLDNWESDIFDLTYKYKIRGEKWGFIRTGIFKEFPFPDDQKFTPESVVWHRIYFKYPALFINQALRTYYVNDNAASLSVVTGNDPRYASGKRMLPMDFINYYFKRIHYRPRLIIINFLLYWKFSFLAKIKLSVALKDINNYFMRLLSVLFILPGYILNKSSK